MGPKGNPGFSPTPDQYTGNRFQRDICSMACPGTVGRIFYNPSSDRIIMQIRGEIPRFVCRDGNKEIGKKWI